jgi:ketosteroid isomerase-like protein
LRALDAWNRRDVDAFVALVSPDVVWEENPELPGLREVYRGRAEVRAWMEEVLEVVESPQLELEEITELGDDRVFGEIFLTGRGKGSGAPVELRFGMAGSFAEGKITRRQVFCTRDEAPRSRRAVGVGDGSSETHARRSRDRGWCGRWVGPRNRRQRDYRRSARTRGRGGAWGAGRLALDPEPCVAKAIPSKPGWA